MPVQETLFIEPKKKVEDYSTYLNSDKKENSWTFINPI